MRDVLVSTASPRLKHVKQIQSSRWSFAAVLFDGSVVSWGRTSNFGAVQASSDFARGQPKNPRDKKEYSSCYILGPLIFAKKNVKEHASNSISYFVVVSMFG